MHEILQVGRQAISSNKTCGRDQNKAITSSDRPPAASYQRASSCPYKDAYQTSQLESLPASPSEHPQSCLPPPVGLEAWQEEFLLEHFRLFHPRS